MNRILGRVVFYSADDLSSSGHLQDAEPLMRGFDATAVHDVNDILELYNIQLYIDADCALRSWSSDEVSLFKEVVKKFKPIIIDYLKHLDDKNFATEYQKVEDELKVSFWELFSIFRIYERIPAALIKEQLEKDDGLIEILLWNKVLVVAYDELFSEYLRGNKDCVDLLLSAYLLELDHTDKKPNIPKSLTLEDKDFLLSEFIDSATPNISLLRIIEQAKDSAELRISPENRLKAKHKAEELYNQMMQNASALTYSIKLELQNSDEDWGVRLINGANNTSKICYNERFLKNYDDERLFTMFADHYEYINQKMMMTMPFNYVTDMVLMEYLSGYHSKKDYPITSAFNLRQQIAVMQMAFHRQYLQGRGKRLEDLIVWYYEDCLKKKYDYPSGKMKLATEENDVVNKIKILYPEIEAVLKRYDMFANKGSVDEEMLYYYQGVHFTETHSILANKYVYPMDGCSDVFRPIRFLFHAGALLDKLPEDYKGDHNLFNTIRESRVSYNVYNEWQRECLDYLIGQGLIKKDKNGVLSFANEGRIAALYDIYHDKVISYWNHPKIVKDEIDNMLASGMLFSEQTLFSKPEKEYLNFLLNDKQFTNGPAIRNTYAHGDQLQVDNAAHETAYNYLLIVLVCILLKIESEFMVSNQQ